MSWLYLAGSILLSLLLLRIDIWLLSRLRIAFERLKVFSNLSAIVSKVGVGVVAALSLLLLGVPNRYLAVPGCLAYFAFMELVILGGTNRSIDYQQAHRQDFSRLLSGLFQMRTRPQRRPGKRKHPAARFRKH